MSYGKMWFNPIDQQSWPIVGEIWSQLKIGTLIFHYAQGSSFMNFPEHGEISKFQF